MASQFFGLNISYSGLMASNAGLNTTANNITNVETEGYSKQVARQEAMDAIRTFTKYGCAGAGVETIAIERMRDEFYDTKFWNNESQSGEFGIKSYYMTQIEDYFRDDDIIKGFSSIFDEMYNALNQLKSNAGDVTVKSQFIGASKNLSVYFNQQYSNLKKLQLDTNEEIKIKTDKINTLATSIASLNKQINVVEVGGGVANELRDRRAVMIDELSKIVDVEVEEFPAIDQNHPEMDTGSNHFRVRIAAGQLLVDTDQYNEIVCVARGSDEKINQTDADGLYDLRWATPGQTFDPKTAPKFNVYGTNLGGELKALVQMRDGNNGEYFNGKITGVTKTADGRQQVKVYVDEDYLTDINKLNLSNSEEGGKITLDNQVMYYQTWELKKEGKGCEYTFTLSDATKNAREYSSGKYMSDPENASEEQFDAMIGSPVRYQGIPYYMRQLNEWVRCYASKFNEIVREGVVTDKTNGQVKPAEDTFIADNGDQIYIDSTKTADKGVKMEDHSYYFMTAENFSVSRRVEDDAVEFPTFSEEGNTSSGESKHDIIDKILSLRTDVTMMSFRGASSGDFLKSIMADITLGTSTANLFSKNYSDISSAIDIQRQSVSSVDSDEESLSLVKYQNAYTLSSKMITTLTEVYDRLILYTGV